MFDKLTSPFPDYPYLLCVFIGQMGVMTRLPKFEVDLPAVPRPHKPMLHDRDVAMAVMYVHRQVFIPLDFRISFYE
jgi:hypothetical protein